MRLRELAHARTGDKGNTSQISVIAYGEGDYAFLAEHVTAERVRAHFAALAPDGVVRYQLPILGALNFVISGALGGGVTRSLRLDAHGKCLGAVLLELEIPDRQRPAGASGDGPEFEPGTAPPAWLRHLWTPPWAQEKSSGLHGDVGRVPTSVRPHMRASPSSYFIAGFSQD